MKCLICGEAELIHDTRDVPYTYKGETTTISNVTGEYCPACGEVYYTGKDAQYVSDSMSEFTKQVNRAELP